MESTWFNANMLSLNQEKTESILFTLKNAQEYKCELVKFLGVYLDSKLDWKKHIDFVAKKLNKILFMLRALRPNVSKGTLKIIYYAHFHSVMAYAVLV